MLVARSGEPVSSCVCKLIHMYYVQCVHVHVYMYICMHILHVHVHVHGLGQVQYMYMTEMLKEEKKVHVHLSFKNMYIASKVMYRTKKSNTPTAVTLQNKNKFPRVGFEPTKFHTLDRALYWPQAGHKSYIIHVYTVLCTCILVHCTSHSELANLVIR